MEECRATLMGFRRASRDMEAGAISAEARGVKTVWPIPSVACSV